MKKWLAVSICLCVFGCSGSSDQTALSPDMGPTADARSIEMDAAPDTRPLRIETNLGPVVGVDEDGLRVFRGMPYAESPVGQLRFRPPVLKTSWTEDFDASAHGPACPQLLDNAAAPPEPNQSEDCLSVNVWAHESTELKPVMIWVHGGGFVVGNGGRDMYNATKLAQRGDVVVVTFNYRVGMLGFLALDELRADSESGATGNFALLDQRMVFEFLKLKTYQPNCHIYHPH